VTNKRLVFHPNRIDPVTGGRSWSANLSAVAGVGVGDRTEIPQTAGFVSASR
jgi:hypothetical protein